MREIKFRAWDDLAKCYRCHLDPLTIQMLVFEQELERGALEQYTGLKDKNGKEIYEGDIVFTVIDPEYRHSYTFKVAVEYETYIDDEYGYHFSGFSLAQESSNYEVIGNIHENPELLNA